MRVPFNHFRLFFVISDNKNLVFLLDCLCLFLKQYKRICYRDRSIISSGTVQFIRQSMDSVLTFCTLSNAHNNIESMS